MKDAKSISVFVKNSKIWTASQLQEAAEKSNFKLDFVNTDSLNHKVSFISQLGKIIIWRSSSLKAPMERTIFLKKCKNKIIINKAILDNPFLAHKLYQQKVLEKYKSISGIDTFHFHRYKEIEKVVKIGGLKFPFIVKKDLGKQGRDVFLVKNFSQLERFKKNLSKYIFQNFIENDGDFRVFVLGGKVLGIMKRVKTDEKEFRNNISLGGKGYEIKDKEVNLKLTTLGLKTASIFGLQLCGVDLIFDNQMEEYKVMEINTVPQWKGLQSVVKINVADEIIDYCQRLLAREKKSTIALVKECYEKNYFYLNSKQFHYSSRKYLWFRSESDWQKLKEYKKKFLDDKEVNHQFKGYFEKIDSFNKSNFPSRQKYLSKYPKLKIYSKMLFNYLIAEVIYQLNLDSSVSRFVSKKEIYQLQQKLIRDEEALVKLSTSAINFLYLAENYLGTKKAKVDPAKLLKIACDFNHNSEKERRLKIYFLSHCIIGASRFYSREIKDHRQTYLQMVKLLEKIITEGYFKTNLNSKLEFLVASKLIDYKSHLKKVITNEAKNSLSIIDNYIIDQLPKTKKTYGDNLLSSEHRNILYLMAMLPRKN